MNTYEVEIKAEPDFDTIKANCKAEAKHKLWVKFAKKRSNFTISATRLD